MRIKSFCLLASLIFSLPTYATAVTKCVELTGAKQDRLVKEFQFMDIDGLLDVLDSYGGWSFSLSKEQKASYSGSHEKLKQYYKEHFEIDPNACDSTRKPILFEIVRHYANYQDIESEKLLYLLLERGADPNIKANGESPLRIAAFRQSIMAMDWLIRYGADITKTDGRFGPIEDLVESWQDLKGEGSKERVLEYIKEQRAEAAKKGPPISRLSALTILK